MIQCCAICHLNVMKNKLSKKTPLKKKVNKTLYTLFGETIQMNTKMNK